MQSFKSIISLWPTRQKLAEDLNAEIFGGTDAANAPVTEQTINSMFWRDSVPSGYWLGLIKAAKRRQHSGVTLEALASIRQEYIRTRGR